MRKWLGTVVLLLIVAAGRAMGQEQQAAIEGIVRDSLEGVTRGVTVVIRNQAGLVLEGLTDARGAYRFPSLPPGSYELTASLAGFIPAAVAGIDLRLGRQLTIDLVLRPAGPAENVAVTVGSPLIAVTQSARTTNLRDDDIEKMPKGRDFTSLATQAAGANNERKLGGLSVDGSSAAENRFIVDGMETTDTQNGLSGQPLVTDFVGEVQVKSSGYSAEYGGSTGAVLNVVTRSGTNVWHGDVLLYVSGDALDAGPRPTLQLNPTQPDDAEYVTYPEDKYRRDEPGFTVAGPLISNRLWVFAGYVPSLQSLRRTATFTADGSTRSFHQDTRVHNLSANIVAAGPRWRSRAAFSSAGQTETGRLPAVDGTSNPDANFGVNTIKPSLSGSLGFDYVPNTRLLLSARVGYFSNNLFTEGVYRGDRYRYRASAVGFPGVPVELQQPSLHSNVPSNFGIERMREQRVAARLDSTLFFHGAGQHQLKGGVQLDRISHDELSGATGNAINLFWGLSFAGQRGPFGYYNIVSNGLFPNLGGITEGQVAVNNVGLYLQDNWRLGRRLTLNLGVRTENEHVPSFSRDPRIPATAIHFGFGDKVAPRLGFAWDATGNGKSKIYGSWGVFFDITKLWLPIGSFGGSKALFDYYTLDTGDISTIVDNSSCPPNCPGRHLLGPLDVAHPANDPDDNLIDPDLGQMRLQEAVVGMEREVRPNLSIGARYIHKQVDRALEDIGTLGENQSNIYTIGNPGFGRAATFYPEGGSSPIDFPKARRDYDAIEATVDRRLSRGWSARAAYTWSRLWGNYSGLSQSDEDGRVSPNVGFNFDYPLMSFDERGIPVYGVLATDRTHRLKANVLVNLPRGTSLGVQGFAATGVPRTRVAQFIPGNDFEVMYRGRNSDGRLPTLRQIDLYVQRTFRVSARWRISVSANITNLLNGSTATNYYPKELYQGQAIVVDEPAFYRGIDTQQLIAGQALVRNARFLMDSGYQAPRTIRLGMRLGF